MVAQLYPPLCDPMHGSPLGSSALRVSRQEYWMGVHTLLQGIFLTQGLTPRLYVSSLGRRVLHHSRQLGSPVNKGYTKDVKYEVKGRGVKMQGCLNVFVLKQLK